MLACGHERVPLAVCCKQLWSGTLTRVGLRAHSTATSRPSHLSGTPAVRRVPCALCPVPQLIGVCARALTLSHTCVRARANQPCSWSRNGRKLLSASVDWNVILWDVASSERIRVYKFDGPVTSARIHPRNDALFVACPLHSVPVLINTANDESDGVRRMRAHMI